MTYDRYLLRSFLHTFGVCFVAMFGLVVIIDLFENLDEMFALNGDNGTLSLMWLIVTLNGYRSVMFIDKAGPALVVISVMTVLIVLQRSGELHPLLAAGIPMYRILRPMILAAIAFNAVLIFNQEVLVPQVAFLEHELRHRNDPSQSEVESLTDHVTRICIDGDRVNVAERTISKPAFVLPPPMLAKELIDLKAEKAVFRPAKGRQPSGWMLQNVSEPPLDELAATLTKKGHELVKIQKNGTSVFVVSAITCDQLFQRSSSFTSLSTPELLARIRCPAFGMVSVHRLVLYLHSRFMQPAMNVIAILLTIPLMVRRESPGLVADSSLCGFILAAVFGITQGFQSLGAGHVIPPDLAAWGPVVIGGALSAWLSGVIRT
ncbi:LptF/LptG family permease [Schlesneria paludicola]|uniref:LptF/LptG family permease n=1 Tax=Schlesneria paludicola TaxID=360056 RepID=UPI00029AFAD6|nr:LptF/LptG family permease [Schlesneria paludicola]